MNKLIFALCLISANMLLTTPAMAAPSYKKGEPFEVTGSITNYYGGEKSAEAIMWEKALQVCQSLSGGEFNSLLTNRLSPIVFGAENFTSTATATFVCLPAGMGH